MSRTNPQSSFELINRICYVQTDIIGKITFTHTDTHALTHTCCILLKEPTKNIIKDNERTKRTKRNTLLYRKLSLSFYFRKGHTVSCNSKSRMERHILKERTSSCPISSSWSQWVPTLAPPCKPYRQKRPNASDQLRIPGPTFGSDWTDCLNLTTWFSYHVVSFRLHICSTGLLRRTAIHLFTHHNVTACQSIQGQQEQTPNPCQQALYNTHI